MWLHLERPAFFLSRKKILPKFSLFKNVLFKFSIYLDSSISKVSVCCNSWISVILSIINIGMTPEFPVYFKDVKLEQIWKANKNLYQLFFVRMYLEMRSKSSNMEIGSKMHFATNWTTVNIATSAVNVISHFFFHATITQHCRILQHIRRLN